MRKGWATAALGGLCTLGFITLAACADETDGAGGRGGSTATTPNGGTGAGTTVSGTGAGMGTGGSGAGSPTGGAGTGGTGEGGSGGGGTGQMMRFVAFGDAGKGNELQFKVADAIKTVCDAAGGCDFALMLGDNLYPSGADSPNDELFDTNFEQPYAELDFPFHVVLGNHDYGADGAGTDFSKGQNEIDYTANSDKWSLPSRYYRMGAPEQLAGPSVDFFMLDTNYIFLLGDDEQQDWLDGEIAASTKHWRIAAGHHPYLSNGPHGNAGDYDGLFFPPVDGSNVKSMVEDALCNKIDVYLSGHDHQRQWLVGSCGVEFIVSGGGAALTDIEGDNPVHFQDDQLGGFLLVEITDTTFTGTFYDENAAMSFTRTITKP